MNERLLFGRLHAMRSGRGVARVAGQFAADARHALRDLPPGWDLSGSAADKPNGAAGLCEWTQDKSPVWRHAARLLRHALLVQASPERVGDFMLALERHGFALITSQRAQHSGKEGGAPPKVTTEEICDLYDRLAANGKADRDITALIAKRREVSDATVRRHLKKGGRKKPT